MDSDDFGGLTPEQAQAILDMHQLPAWMCNSPLAGLEKQAGSLESAPGFVKMAHHFGQRHFSKQTTETGLQKGEKRSVPGVRFPYTDAPAASSVVAGAAADAYKSRSAQGSLTRAEALDVVEKAVERAIEKAIVGAFQKQFGR